MTVPEDVPDDNHGQWAYETFAQFIGPDGKTVPAATVRRSSFVKWLRAFIADMVMIAQLQQTQTVRTARIIAILYAKAQGNCITGLNPHGGLTAGEFDSCTRVLSEPSVG